MWPLLFLCTFILTTSAQRLRQRQDVGGLNGVAAFDSYLPLQYSFVSAPALASSTAVAGAVTTATGSIAALSNDNVNINGGTAVSGLTGTAASAYSAAAASVFAAENSILNAVYPSLTGTAAVSQSAAIAAFDATAFPSLTGSAAAAESAAVASDDALFAAQDSFYATALSSLTGSAAVAYSAALASEEAALNSAFPPLTGSAATAQSAAFAAFDSQDNYYATVGPLTGSALAAESAHLQSEDSYYASAFPPLTGSAAAVESAAFASQDSYYASAFPPLTGTAAAAESAAFVSRESYYATAFPVTGSAASLTAYDSADPVLTGTAAAAYSAALASFDSAYATATAIPSAPLKDACGPTIPDPTVPDSCDTPVQQVSAPAAWGVQCLNDTGSTTPINITSCAPLITELCSNQWQNLGQWTWLTAPGCALGSFLPPKSFAGAAPGPSQTACEELIYASMVDDCQYSGTPWNLAGVNVKVFPAEAASGEAVNVGYGSYVVASRQLRTVSDATDCTFLPADDYCRGSRCYPPDYYRSRFSKPTPCAALGSPAASFRGAGG